MRITSFRRVIALAVILQALGFRAANATDYYVQGPLVAAGVADPGTGAQDNPFRSFWAPMHVLAPGDTLHILAGSYSALLYLTVSGNASAPINIVGDPGMLTQIHTASGNAIQFKAGVSYVSVSYFDVQAAASTASGIATEGASPVHHITIKHNRVHNCGGAGLQLTHADYLSVVKNTVYDNAWLSNGDPSGIDLYQLTNVDSSTTGNHNYIGSNVIYGNANHVASATSGLITDGNGIIVDDSQHTQLNYAAVAPAYLGGTLIENNIIFNNGGRAVHVNRSNNVTIRNNTTYKNNTGPSFVGLYVGEVEAMGSGNVSVYNNILWGNGSGYTSFQAQGSTNIWIDYNVAANVGTPTYIRLTTGTSWGSHSMTADPLFDLASILPATANFHILASSPAVGAGKPGAGAAYDFDGVKRPTIAALGAYE